MVTVSAIVKCVICQGIFHDNHNYYAFPWLVTQSASVRCSAEAEAAVRAQVFDVRSEARCLGVWAGAGTDGGRV